jgi:hypothetical protein
MLIGLFWTPTAAPQTQEPNPTYEGYQGIWFTLGQMSEYGDKYSGGLGTYTAKHRPIAVYSVDANKTFFVYGGAKKQKRHLLIMIGSYDHGAKTVSRPIIVHDKNGVDDPHDNASIAIDGDGHIWVFISGRGRARPGFKYRSTVPNAIEAFERISEEEFTYPQPVWVPGEGFLHCFTKYTKGRELYWNTSVNGEEWSKDQKLAGMGGHYQVTERKGSVVYTAFNYHPKGVVDKRTNLYFLKTSDTGNSWQNVTGDTIATPLTIPTNSALVRNFESERRLVYLKDIQFDYDGNPVILIVTSSDHKPGPAGEPRIWTVVHWNGTQWDFHEVTRSTHNYDMGQLWIEKGKWRVIGPTEKGPQPWGTGGEIALWESTDEGKIWKKIRQLTNHSKLNHAYVRRPLNAHPDFYALWADGNPDEMSPSRLYFTNHAGDRVWQLPYVMQQQNEMPKLVHRTQQ